MHNTLSRRSLFAGALGLSGAALAGREVAADGFDELDFPVRWAQYEPPDGQDDTLILVHRLLTRMTDEGKHPYEVRLNPVDAESLMVRFPTGRLEFGRSRPNAYGGFDGEVFSVVIAPFSSNPPGSIEIAYTGGPNWEDHRLTPDGWE